MSTTPTNVSVVVCAYTMDRWDDIVRAITSLRGQTVPATEVIVVIDHNPDLLARVRTTWPDITALENQGTRGLSGARNTGVAASSGEIIAFLDDDAEAAPDWLEKLMSVYADPGVLGAGGAILPSWTTERPAWFPEEFDWVVGCTYRGMPERRATQRNLIGANMSFRRELFTVAGNFETSMGRIGTRPLGCEETELCIRAAHKLPARVYVYEPAARVRHTVPASRASWRYFVSRCYSEGLSKAQVAELVGADAGLASERAHVLRTLPAGVWRNIKAAIIGGDASGLGRAAAIVLGLGVTAIGYGRGMAEHRLLMHRSGTFSLKARGATGRVEAP